MDHRIYMNGQQTSGTTGNNTPRVCGFHNSTGCPCVAADNAEVVTSAPEPADSHTRMTIPAPPPVTAVGRHAIEGVMASLEESRASLRVLQDRARTQVTPRELADDLADEIELAGVAALECVLALRHLIEPLP